MDTRTLVGFVSEILGVVAVVMLLGLSPRLAPLPIAFRDPQREVLWVGALYAVLLAVSSLSLFMPGWDIRQTFGQLTPADINRGLRTDLLYRFVVVLVSLIPIGAAAARKEHATPWHSLGWNKRDLRSGLQLGLALGVLTLFLSARYMALLDGISLEDFFTLVVWLGIALAEETIFRGYIQTRMSARFGVPFGVVGAALMFTLYALPALIVRPDALIQIAIVLVRSLVVGWLFTKTRHVLAGALYRGISSWIPFI